MNTPSKLTLPRPVTDLRRRLDLWRRTRAKPGPLPVSLWNEAADLARRHGVSPIARALRLEYYCLKRRVKDRRPVAEQVRPAFVEVSMLPPAPPPECAVELERPDGARMRVRLSRPQELVALAETFWRWRA